MTKVPSKGDLSSITPLYLSFTSTWSKVGQRPDQSDFSMRSKENLTSSVVTSPRPLLHISPFFKVKGMCMPSSDTLMLSTNSEGFQPHVPSAPSVVTARHGMQANSV